MKIVYAGTPQFAVAPLRTLIEGGYDVVAVITQEDRPFGRKAIVTPPPVKVCAAQAGIPVYQFSKIREHVREIEAFGADVMFTCAYGQLLTEAVLRCFPLGVWNVHASLLPRYRGASPVQAAMLAGETHTGITVMKTELALDSGDILLVKRCEILPGETCGELSDRLSLMGAQALSEAADMIERGDINLLLQDEAAATFCKKIKKEDAKIDFSAPAKAVCALINAMSPSPAAYCISEGRPLNFYRAFLSDADCPRGACGEVSAVGRDGIIINCGDGFVRVTEAQFSGGKRLSAVDIFNGRKLSAGDVLE